MGIRFLCSACGKKLNIKEELAGKKGRCPKCNEKITIPKESSLANIEDPPQVSGKSASGKSKEDSPSKEVAVQVAVKPQPAAKKQEVKKSTRQSKVPAQSKKESLSESSQKETAPPPLPNSNESVEQGDPASDLTTESQTQQDVFAEAPDANWFVRPSSGGQFGPAEPDVMKGWLSEGRVGLDSLVWREGWEEWQNAGDVFKDELGASPDPPAEKKLEQTQSSTSAGQQGTRAINHQLARRKARTMGIVLVVGLAVVSITLVVVLIYVVKNSGGSGDKEDKKESASLSFEFHKNHNQLLKLDPQQNETNPFEVKLA